MLVEKEVVGDSGCAPNHLCTPRHQAPPDRNRVSRGQGHVKGLQKLSTAPSTGLQPLAGGLTQPTSESVDGCVHHPKTN